MTTTTDRHESHSSRSQAAFLVTVSRVTKLPVDEAEAAAVAVLCALEHRLFGSAPRKLEAQLPSRLRERVQGCRLHAGQPPRKLSRGEFLHFVGDHLHKTPEESELITQGVFQALQIQLSPGETEHVIAQLPRSIARLWTPVDHGALSARGP